MSNMVTRYLTALVALPLLLLLILFGPDWLFDLVISIALLLALIEWVDLLNRMDLRVSRVLSLVMGSILLGSMAVFAESGQSRYLMLGLFLVLTGICLERLLRPGDDLREASLAVFSQVFVLVLICWGGGALMLVRDLSGNIAGAHLVILLLCLAWAGDAGAMHAGKSFGRHKLAPVVSPNKTVEGFLGAIAAGTAAGCVAYVVLPFPFPLYHVFILGPLVVTLAHIGDLTESLSKRGADIKDSGSLIPGHGGFLDRLDNVLLTAPFLYLYAVFFLGV